MSDGSGVMTILLTLFSVVIMTEMARWETSSASLARIVVVNFLSEVFTALLPLLLFRESRGSMKEISKVELCCATS